MKIKDTLNSRGAFTLIELLTVIAIIGILAAIIIPVTNRVQDAAQASVCSSNTRQLALAMLAYADDHNGRLPTMASRGLAGPQPDDWIYWQQDRELADSAIASYVGGAGTIVDATLFRCPSDRFWNDPPREYPYSYGMNSQLASGTTVTIAGPSHYTQGYLHRIPNPTRVILIAEMRDAKEDNLSDTSAARRPVDGHWWPPSDPITRRHGERGHVAAADASVSLVSDDFRSLRWSSRVTPDPSLWED